MTFINPNAFWLFILLPIFVVIGWPRLAYRRRRDAISLVIRLLLLTAIIIALAGPQVQRTADKLAVVFLIDVSDSMSPAMQSAAVEYVREATDVMEVVDQAAVVVFGADALVEIPITERLELVQIGSDPIRLNTDLAEAMRVGLALFPADTAKRMVILSDGKQTVGDAEEVARLAAATDVQIDYVFLGADRDQFSGPEVLVRKVDAPTTVNEGEKFNLTVTLESNRRNSLAEIRVLSGGRVIHRREIELPLGVTNEVFEIVAPTSGFADFLVVVEPRSADNFYQNNQLSAFTEVTGPPRVLLVTTDEQEIVSLRNVLEETGLIVDVQGPRDLPIGLAPLSSYNTIIMANVPATEMSPDRMEHIQAYVRDLGGGLVVIGGPESYGVGGYFDTPLEETLPVEMRLKDQERIPTLTMLFVIDRSGSMEISSAGGVSNLELAKEAVVRSIDLLNNNDRIGAISFDVSSYFVVETQAVGDEANRQAIRDEVGKLRPGGGTSIRQGILSADQVLRDDPSQLKHIILLTDGGADETGIAAAVNRMYENYGITTSVVAVGRDYAQWLHDVALAGNGKFHLAYDVSTIPAIFTAETLLATRSYIFEEDFYPTITARHPIITGFDSSPLLHGYVATTEKDTATVILRAPEDDPLLAAWQYGLGRAVAFTSDASSRWAAEWLDWPGYADFWNQAVRWTITRGTTNNIEVRVVERGEQAVLVVNVRDPRGDYLNGMELEASVTNARLDRVDLVLQQTAPGRYEASFTPQDEGAYFITVAGSTPENASVSVVQNVIQRTGWVLSYSAEYRVDSDVYGQDAPVALLERVAQIAGGGTLEDNPGSAFYHNLNQEQAAQPVWQYFVLAALLLLPLDVAIRRIVITASDLDRVREWVRRRVMRRPRTVASMPPSPHLGRLMDAKQRVHMNRSPEAPEGEQTEPGMTPSEQEPEDLRTRPVPGDTGSTSRILRRKATPRAPQKRHTSVPSPPTSSPQRGTLASRLLESRRSSSDQDES